MLIPFLKRATSKGLICGSALDLILVNGARLHGGDMEVRHSLNVDVLPAYIFKGDVNTRWRRHQVFRRQGKHTMGSYCRERCPSPALLLMLTN